MSPARLQFSFCLFSARNKLVRESRTHKIFTRAQCNCAHFPLCCKTSFRYSLTRQRVSLWALLDFYLHTLWPRICNFLDMLAAALSPLDIFKKSLPVPFLLLLLEMWKVRYDSHFFAQVFNIPRLKFYVSTVKIVVLHARFLVFHCGLPPFIGKNMTE